MGVEQSSEQNSPDRYEDGWDTQNLYEPAHGRYRAQGDPRDPYSQGHPGYRQPQGQVPVGWDPHRGQVPRGAYPPQGMARPPVPAVGPYMRPDDEDTPMVPRIAVVQDDLTPADSASAVGRPNSPGAPIGYSPIDTSTIPSDGLREEIDSLRREAQAARQAQALAEAKVKILENELLRSREDLRKANDRNSDLLTHFGKQVESLETEINTMSEKGYGGPNGTRNDEFIAVQQELIATKMECQKRESELERLKELAAEELSHLHGNTITKKYPMAN